MNQKSWALIVGMEPGLAGVFVSSLGNGQPARLS